jgi:hypothetical protein
MPTMASPTSNQVIFSKPSKAHDDSPTSPLSTTLTNDNTLPAYQIVLLYKHRWDIEKIFHQFKSKMGERKSWASSLDAKQSHAKKEETEKINFLLDVATAKSFLWAWRKFGGLLPGRIRKRNLPYITALHGSWTSVLLLGRMIRSSSAFTCA